jgi:BirA family biotin operon repressor/biotin-[acetyl-CoA-carboxylase] ligase
VSDDQFTEPFLAELRRQNARDDREIVFHTCIDSTSTDLKRRLGAGLGPGAVVAADMQEKGRGRRGNVWHSPSEGNLYLSLAVAVPEPFQRTLPLLPLAAGIAIWDVVDRIGIVEPKLKWPNDLLVAKRKLAGILCESKDTSKRPVVAIVGLGVNMGTDAFPDQLKEIATSLKQLSGYSIDSAVLAARWVAGLEQWIRLIAQGKRSELVDAWRERAEPFGRRVRVGEIEGETVDLAEDGRLILRKDNGEQTVVSGGIVESIDP